MALDVAKLNSFVGHFVGDLGATVHAGMVVLGEKLGLYKALAEAPATSAELATRTTTDERYIREWLASQAAGGYVTFNEATGKFSLTEEQAFTLANEDSPAYLPGAFELALGALAAVPRITEAFRSGAGVGWHEHEESVFHGCEKFFRPGYAANLVSAWIPALTEVQGKLENGARVADVGCGKGASTVLMAQAFPNSTFFGFDYHDQSIEERALQPNGSAWTREPPSAWPKPRNSPVPATISSPSSTVCTIWETPSAPQSTFSTPCTRTAHG